MNTLPIYSFEQYQDIAQETQRAIMVNFLTALANTTIWARMFMEVANEVELLSIEAWV